MDEDSFKTYKILMIAFKVDVCLNISMLAGLIRLETFPMIGKQNLGEYETTMRPVVAGLALRQS